MADNLAESANEKNQAGFVVSDDIEERAVGFEDKVGVKRRGAID